MSSVQRKPVGQAARDQRQLALGELALQGLGLGADGDPSAAGGGAIGGRQQVGEALAHAGAGLEQADAAARRGGRPPRRPGRSGRVARRSPGGPPRARRRRSKAARQPSAAQARVAGRPSARGSALGKRARAPPRGAHGAQREGARSQPSRSASGCQAAARSRRRSVSESSAARSRSARKQAGRGPHVGEGPVRRLAEVEQRGEGAEAVAVDLGQEQQRGLQRVEAAGGRRRRAAARRRRAQHGEVEGDVLADDHGVAGEGAQLLVGRGEGRRAGEVVGRDAGQPLDLQGQRTARVDQGAPGGRDAQGGVEARSPDLDHAVAARVEPGGLGVDDDELCVALPACRRAYHGGRATTRAASGPCPRVRRRVPLGSRPDDPVRYH